MDWETVIMALEAAQFIDNYYYYIVSTYNLICINAGCEQGRVTFDHLSSKKSVPGTSLPKGHMRRSNMVLERSVDRRGIMKNGGIEEDM